MNLSLDGMPCGLNIVARCAANSSGYSWFVVVPFPHAFWKGSIWTEGSFQLTRSFLDRSSSCWHKFCLYSWCLFEFSVNGISCFSSVHDHINRVINFFVVEYWNIIRTELEPFIYQLLQHYFYYFQRCSSLRWLHIWILHNSQKSTICFLKYVYRNFFLILFPFWINPTLTLFQN